MSAAHFIVVVFVIVSPPLQAATSNAGRAGAPSYDVDTGASRVFVKVGSATALGHPHGVESRLKGGKLAFGGGGELVFDMSSFTADTPESHKRTGLEAHKTSDSDAKKVTETMRSASVLDAAHFPTATFTIAAVKPLQRQPAGTPGMYQLDGEFALRGVKQKLQINAKLEQAGQQRQMRLSGSFQIKQSDYHIKPYSTFGGVVKVTDELEITGDLLLTPAAR